MEFTRKNTLREVLEYPRMAQGLQQFLSDFLLEMFPKEMQDEPLSAIEKAAETPWDEPFSVVTDQLLAAVETVQDITERDKRRCIPLWTMKEQEEFTGSEAWTKRDGSKKDGVFLLAPVPNPQEDREKRPAVIICPGGGYTDVCFSNEGNPIMRRMEEAGCRAFVLRYRIGPARFPEPQKDLTLAIQYVRAFGGAYGVDTNQIMIMGSSAGGHLCASVAAEYEYLKGLLAEDLKDSGHPLTQRLKGILARPNMVCLNYPVISFVNSPHEGSFQELTGGEEGLREKLSVERLVTPDYPPTFLWACADDGTVPPENTRLMLKALQKNGVNCEGHIYPAGGHGCGLALAKSARDWSERMLHFMSSVFDTPQDSSPRIS